MSAPYKSCLFMRVEIEPGTSDTDAAIALTMLATDMQMTVEATQRETVMRGVPGGSWEKVLGEFQRDERLASYPQS